MSALTASSCVRVARLTPSQGVSLRRNRLRLPFVDRRRRTLAVPEAPPGIRLPRLATNPWTSTRDSLRLQAQYSYFDSHSRIYPLVHTPTGVETLLRRRATSCFFIANSLAVRVAALRRTTFFSLFSLHQNDFPHFRFLFTIIQLCIT